MRYRAGFAYVDGVLADGEVLRLCRLRYAGSAREWGFAIYRASHAPPAHTGIGSASACTASASRRRASGSGPSSVSTAGQRNGFVAIQRPVRAASDLEGPFLGSHAATGVRVSTSRCQSARQSPGAHHTTLGTAPTSTNPRHYSGFAEIFPRAGNPQGCGKRAVCANRQSLCTPRNAPRRGPRPTLGAGLVVSRGAKCLHNTFGGGLVEMPAIGRRDQAATVAVHEHKVLVVTCDDLPCGPRLSADRIGSEFGAAPFKLPPGGLGPLGFFTCHIGCPLCSAPRLSPES